MPLSLSTYQTEVTRFAKPDQDPDRAIANWGLGVTGEAGDLAGCIKKTLFHGNDQTAGIRENVGDTMWYLAMICNHYGWQLEDVLQENIDKLSKRYASGGFSEEEAARGGTRVDWNEKE